LAERMQIFNSNAIFSDTGMSISPPFHVLSSD